MAAATHTKELFSRVTAVTRKGYDETTVEGQLLKAAKDYESEQIPDPFAGAYRTVDAVGGDFEIIAPPYPPNALMRLPTQNATLGPCIAAMKTNIEGFGYTLEYKGPKGQTETQAVKDEKNRIEDLLEQPNGEYSLRTLRERMRVDYETLGWSALEIGREGSGDVAWIEHVPGHSVRMSRSDVASTSVKVYLKRDGKDYREITIKRRFRRFIQLVGGKRVYFKEFGDPRKISSKTGRFDGQDNVAVSDDEAATEILWLSQYVSGELYGLPRYICELPSVLGSREAELMNLEFFQDNGIPALAILVSGGLLTDETVSKIEEIFEKRGRGTANRVVVFEARTAPDANPLMEGTTSTVPKLEIQPLAGERQSDELFQAYDKNSAAKIRSAFRIPPLFIGLAEDYTKASAIASLETADSQVFSPERLWFDDIMNRQILLHDGKPPQFWSFRTNPAKIVSSESVVSAIKSLDTVGGMTPNVARQLANELLDMHLPPFTEKWGDIPFAIIKGLVTSGRMIPEGLEKSGQILDATKGSVTDNKVKTPVAGAKAKPTANK